VAAFTGARWRFIQIPDAILDSDQAVQLGWVQQRCREHYIEAKGVCLCFGQITGYGWRQQEDVSVLLDIEGRVVDAAHTPSTPGRGTLTVGNKSLEVVKDGSLKIDAALDTDK